MYNRYVPQSDGSYRRDHMPEPQSPAKPPSPPPPPPTPSDPSVQPQSHPPLHSLTKLLPKGLDMGDLLVIVLLLLMAGDCEEDKNSMLLTLALYLFL